MASRYTVTVQRRGKCAICKLPEAVRDQADDFLYLRSVRELHNGHKVTGDWIREFVRSACGELVSLDSLNRHFKQHIAAVGKPTEEPSTELAERDAAASQELTVALDGAQDVAGGATLLSRDLVALARAEIARDPMAFVRKVGPRGLTELALRGAAEERLRREAGHTNALMEMLARATSQPAVAKRSEVITVDAEVVEES